MQIAQTYRYGPVVPEFALLGGVGHGSAHRTTTTSRQRLVSSPGCGMLAPAGTPREVTVMLNGENVKELG